MSVLSAPPAFAAPFVWDQDEDGVDDRMESVHLFGYHFSFEEGDTLQRQRIEAIRLAGSVLYGVYVVYEQDPTPLELAALTALGMPVLYRYVNVPAVRSVATFLQAQQAAAQPGVERIEAVPILYPNLRNGAAAIGVRDPSHSVFPTWSGAGYGDGSGVVIAFLDTGINDQADGAYPGHESLTGRFVGGAVFLNSDSTSDTPKNGSVNPVDRGGTVTRSHGTHVAGIALGTGGSSQFARGVAPQARFVDVKVLNDAGIGTGVPEALDWCIHNRDRNWGAGAEYQGIDVINLSLSSLDPADGNDVASRLAARAVELGMVVVASMGNEGQQAYVPSPAAGDGVIAVASYDDQRTPLSADDLYASFNDQGPRFSDGDADAYDELKPDLLAPGVAVLSADGNLSTNGGQYRRSSGSSMSAAYVSGAVAAIRSAFPSYGPSQIAELLRATALRHLKDGSAATGVDPRWDARIGFGAVDLYAALLEATQPTRSQIRRFSLEGAGSLLTARLWTQRELGAAHFVFERAPDQGGVPGAFAAIDSVPAAGVATLDGPVNHTAYARLWTVPTHEYGQTFWYRVAYSENGVRYQTEPRATELPRGPRSATIKVTVVHNAYDNDIDAWVDAGNFGQPPALRFDLPATSKAVASDWVTGTSVTGNIRWKFEIPVPAGAADAYLPPNEQHPWALRLIEGGYLNRKGTLENFSLVWNQPAGNIEYFGGPTPQTTMESQTTYATIPQSVVAVDGNPLVRPLTAYPNPAMAGGRVVFRFGADPGGPVRIFDLAGREVARLALAGSGERQQAVWNLRDRRGEPLSSGVYFVRAGAAGDTRVVILRP